MSFASGQLCRFYSRGKICRYGDACRYQHTVRDLSTASDHQAGRPLAEESPPSLLNPGESCPKITPEGNYEGLNQENCDQVVSQASNSLSETTSGIKICSFFAKRRWCSFGKKCRFLHEIPDTQHAVSQASSIAPVPSTADSLPFQQKDNEDDSQAVDRQQGPETSSHDDKKNEKRICNFFARTGRCHYGQRCHFQHDKNHRQVVKQSQNIDRESKKETVQASEKSKSVLDRPDPTRSNKRLCPYFKKGYCRWGERCRFWHPMDMMDDLIENFDESVDIQETSNHGNTKIAAESKDSTNGSGARQQMSSGQRQQTFPSRPPVKPPNQKILLRRETASQEEMDKLRKTEIDQLKKRFPRDRCKVINDDPDTFQCNVNFHPSDPDWPYDVKNFELEFTIPSTYPREMLSITLPEDQDLPATVGRYLDSCVVGWVKEKRDYLETQGNYEIIFRPFLRWFDKSLEANVTEALKQMKREIVAKAAGFQFINATELQTKYKASENNEDLELDGSEEDSDEYSDVDSGETCSDEDSEPTPASHNTDRDMDTEKKGTEITLKNLQLREGANTLMCDKIHITIQCGRCKNHTDFNTPSHRINSVSCTKCNQSQLLTFRPVLMHQFSSVMGYLDLENCTAFDLVLQDCEARVGCVNCSKESKISGLLPGQVSNTWCRHCHQKMKIATDTVQFFQLQPSGVVTDPKQKVHEVAIKKRRVLKDPAIKEGKPLPDNGACKHYKKSYRWFRFPCCGMVYPCDVCHDEQSDGHEMVFANRVICGFCCKEQMYAPDRPCVTCQQMLTRGKSSHWEGGLGCRNKVKMGKNDSQKYSSLNKTISRQAQKLKESRLKKGNKHRNA
ncbi:uncharacterized protein LOC124142396 [Haliotis rufescens]|uniref:uncharacterized protein LOC124142396 n=1 Tax=Haliotis rufescens TaxID=6454 RepID=UPI00201F17D9|nr:uncharacterized protein LOC124142396 [Haliotis rufescens]